MMEKIGEIMARESFRRELAEGEARRQAEVSRRAEEFRKRTKEEARRLAEALVIAETCLRLRQEETASKEPGVSFSSLAELFEDVCTKGRDLFVADLAKNHANYYEGDNDCGVIYIIICLIDLTIYVGQTIHFDNRMRNHLRGAGNAPLLRDAIKKHGREKFVCVKLLAGINPGKELDSIEGMVIMRLACERGYSCDGLIM